MPIYLRFLLASLCFVASSAIAQNRCAEPNSVAQSLWRAGLSNPVGERVGLNTTHIVIHHSADVNMVLSDYTSLVRNIYNIHTSENGWDDIGYNYLIDPNGVIYKGREPQTLTQDVVQGAHMCNKNENTIGICLIGTFTNNLPTKEALKSLYLLAGWKVSKDKIDPFGETMHEIGPTSANMQATMLANVCGHRDGCQPGYTECPGTSFYNTFQTVRDSISYYSTKCIATGFSENEASQFRLLSIKNNVFMIPSDNFETVKIYDSIGQTIIDFPFAIDLTNAQIPSNEFLIMVLQNSKGKYFRLKIKLD